MRNRLLIALAIIGILAGFVSAYIFGIKQKPQPPVFKPASNPYEKGIYANGIIESYQTSGENINIYPEVPGTVRKILIAEGQHVTVGTPLLMLDDSVQRAAAEQQKAQSESAKAQIGLRLLISPGDGTKSFMFFIVSSNLDKCFGRSIFSK